jgi:hypothetical protein
MTTESPATTGFVSLTGVPPFNAANIPGSWASNTTGKAALTPFPVRTTTSTELTSGISKGTIKLTCAGDTNRSGAAMPPNNTCVPAASVGMGKPLADAVAVARLLPKMVTSDPRAATGTLDALRPVAALTRLPMDGS